jgi:hypothetical protein
MNPSQKDKWPIAVWVLSSIFGIGGTIVILRGQDAINHRLDVDDAWQLKGTYEAGKGWQSEAQELRAFTERLIEHCKVARNGCNLPDHLTSVPSGRGAPSMDLVITRVKTK